MPRPDRKRPDYRIDVPAFSGPLDLLLHLIEREELDITAISLARVTEQYLDQVNRLKQDKIEHLVDFLVVGAQLLVIKSRALLPQTPLVPPEEEEEDPAEALMRQLHLYRQFKSAAAWLHSREEQGLRTYLRVAPPPKVEGKLDLSGVTVDTLIQALRQVLERAQKMEGSVEVVQPRHVTIDDQIKLLRSTLHTQEAVAFQELLSEDADRIEVAVTLLAILELIKRLEVTAHQKFLFGPIELRAADGGQIGEEEAPTAPPGHQ